MPALPACILDPIKVEFLASIPERVDEHPLGCHRPRINDSIVFDHLVQALVSGMGYEKVADSTCSATTMRVRRDEWIAAHLFQRLKETVIAAYQRFIGLDLNEVAIDGWSPRVLRSRVQPVDVRTIIRTSTGRGTHDQNHSIHHRLQSASSRQRTPGVPAPPEAKATVVAAATALDMDTSDFARDVLLERAEEVIAERAITTLVCRPPSSMTFSPAWTDPHAPTTRCAAPQQQPAPPSPPSTPTPDPLVLSCRRC